MASPLFLQNLDTSVMTTALPRIATALEVPPLHLNLAITSYLLSLAVFLPISGWLADRFGPKRVFCMAIALFSLGSALCGIATSLSQLVMFRVVQGLGGAMMVPVGRLILLRTIPPAQMVSAMVWFTVPPVIGRMVGPLFGGAIVTYTSWRWIFLVNVPFGLAAIALAASFVKDTPATGPSARFDLQGFLMLALGLSALLGAMETAGKALAPAWVSWAAALAGALALALYVRHSRRREHPIIDLSILRFRTMRTNVLGGTPLRVAIGAAPFLLPLMLQLGFGLSPLASGLLTMGSAIGALGTRVVMRRFIKAFGFRHLLIGSTVLSSLLYLSYAFFSPATPHWLIFGLLLVNGLTISLGMVSLGTLGFSEVPAGRMSHGTALYAMAQQLAISVGVVLGASLVAATSWWHGGHEVALQARDFVPAFVVVSLVSALSLRWFVRLHPDDGKDMR